MKLDKYKFEGAIVIICLGIVLRLALINYSNIEPVLPLAIIAGYVLGRWYALFVPLIMMILSDWLVYVFKYGTGYGLDFIIALSFFTWSGMMLAGFIGQRVRPRMVLRMGNLAVFTGIGIVTVLIYDAWTMIGWKLLGAVSWETVLIGQVSFTIYHILSTLIFVPLFGTGYIYLRDYGLPILERHAGEEPADETSKAF